LKARGFFHGVIPVLRPDAVRVTRAGRPVEHGFLKRQTQRGAKLT
jgi:hypothetical protein